MAGETAQVASDTSADSGDRVICHAGAQAGNQGQLAARDNEIRPFPLLAQYDPLPVSAPSSANAARAETV